MKLRPLIGITLLAFLIVVIVIAAMECYGGETFGYNAPEVDDMTMHKFPRAQSLAEVVGQDRYTMAQLSERVDGIIRRGVVSRVRPTGEGFEYTFPEGVDAVYLVDVEIYNPGARPVTLRAIESAIPVRPGQGVRVLIPGGDVTRGPIVMGRLTPHESDSVVFTRAEPLGIQAGLYPAIGWPRVWILDINVSALQVMTSLPSPPNNPERQYPETVLMVSAVSLSIPTVNGGTHNVALPFEAVLPMQAAGGVVIYSGQWQGQHIVAIDDVADLGARDLTQDMPVDNRTVSLDIQSPGAILQGAYRGNTPLELVSSNATGHSYGFIEITMSELGVGTK